MENSHLNNFLDIYQNLPIPSYLFLICDIYIKDIDEEGMQEWESLESIQYIMDACKEIGINTLLYTNIYKLLEDLINHYRNELNNLILWNLIEGLYSRNREGYIPSLAEFLGIASTGSDAYSQVLTLDKYMFKNTLPRHLAGNYGLGIHNNDIEKKDYPYPIFIKPRYEGSSLGIGKENILENYNDWERFIRKIQKSKYLSQLDTNTGWIWEEYLNGKEYTVCLLETSKGWIATAAEIRYPSKVYSNSIKSKESMPETIHPIKDRKKFQFLVDESIQIAKLGKWEGYGRLDWKENHEGIPIVLEANLTPGLSPIYSLYPKIWEIFGNVSFKNLLHQILVISWKNYLEKKRYYYGKIFQQRMDSKVKK